MRDDEISKTRMNPTNSEEVKFELINIFWRGTFGHKIQGGRSEPSLRSCPANTLLHLKNPAQQHPHGEDQHQIGAYLTRNNVIRKYRIFLFAQQRRLGYDPNRNLSTRTVASKVQRKQIPRERISNQWSITTSLLPYLDLMACLRVCSALLRYRGRPALADKQYKQEKST